MRKQHWTHDAVVPSLTTCHMDLEPSPPDGVLKTSQWLSMANNRQDKETGNRPGDVESDSGDSLFITQKPVANAGRSGRQRSTPISPSFLEGSWSSNDPEADRGLGKKKNRIMLWEDFLTVSETSGQTVKAVNVVSCLYQQWTQTRRR